MTVPEPTQLPETKPKRPYKIALVAFTLGVVLTATVWIISAASSSGYQEDAHQRALEAAGVSVSDWGQYRDTVFEVCDLDEDAFALFITQTSESYWAATQIDIFYVCPERIDEFDEVMQIVN